MKKLYKFYWDRRPAGTIEGLFIATEDQVDEVVGEEIYFGSVLGEHSEISGLLFEEDVRVVSEDPYVIALLESRYGRTISGHNPLEYYEGALND